MFINSSYRVFKQQLRTGAEDSLSLSRRQAQPKRWGRQRVR